MEDPNATIQEQLAIAKARRARAEMARQKITSEIIEATRELYQKLVSEGEQTLEKAKQQDVESELKHLEAQSELERAQRAKAEADAYLEKAIAQAQQQAREILEQAQAIKAEAAAFREKLLVQAQQAQAELDRAQAARVEADAYREKVLAETQQQAREILRQAHLTVERETAETRRQHATDSEPILARPRPIKAAPEQLETQRQRSQDASLETEFKPKEGSKRVRTRPGNRKSSTAGSPRPKTLSSLLNGPAKDASPLNSDQGNPQSGDNRAVSAGIPEICNPPLASSGILEATVSKKRPAKNELVVGLELDGRAKAYPVRLASGSKIINDDLAGEDVVVVFGPLPSQA